MIYFIQSGKNGPVKIGYAADVQRRVVKMRADNPAELFVLGVTEGGRDLEGTLHLRFADLRLEGEWFEPAPSLLDWIARNASAFDASGRKRIGKKPTGGARKALLDAAERLGGQGKAAALIGVTRQALNMIILGRRNPNRLLAMKIHAVCGVNVLDWYPELHAAARTETPSI